MGDKIDTLAEKLVDLTVVIKNSQKMQTSGQPKSRRAGQTYQREPSIFARNRDTVLIDAWIISKETRNVIHVEK